MVGWHHWFNGHEFGQTLGNGEGRGKAGLLQSLGLPRAGHDMATKQQQNPSSLIFHQQLQETCKY